MRQNRAYKQMQELATKYLVQENQKATSFYSLGAMLINNILIFCVSEF
jgi:hypothetical protein